MGRKRKDKTSGGADTAGSVLSDVAVPSGAHAQTYSPLAGLGGDGMFRGIAAQVSSSVAAKPPASAMPAPMPAAAAPDAALKIEARAATATTVPQSPAPIPATPAVAAASPPTAVRRAPDDIGAGTPAKNRKRYEAWLDGLKSLKPQDLVKYAQYAGYAIVGVLAVVMVIRFLLRALG
jgi:hypothetical protein